MMSPDRIIAAAVRNRSNREGQIERLAPVAVAASQKRTELIAMKTNGAAVVARTKEMWELTDIPNFFPTPREIIDKMLGHARIQNGMTVLEPSAGRGDLIDALAPLGVDVVAYEIIPRLVNIVRTRGHRCRIGDFLAVRPGDLEPVDRVFMNPPFERGSDAKHIQHAFHFLKPGGLLVSVATQTTCRRLEEWASDRRGYVVELPAGAFLKSARPTAVCTGLIVAEKEEP